MLACIIELHVDEGAGVRGRGEREVAGVAEEIGLHGSKSVSVFCCAADSARGLMSYTKLQTACS